MALARTDEALTSHGESAVVVPDGEAVERVFRAMNTDVHVIVVPPRGDSGERALDAAQQAVGDREARWSRFLADSELSVLNRAAGRPVMVSPDTFELVRRAIGAWHVTSGIFDPTIGGSLIAAGYDRSFELLDTAEPFGFVEHVPSPTPAAIELHDATCSIVLPPGTSLDLGGIAKGAACDAIVAEMLELGAVGCCVNIGGDLRASGTPPDPRGWTVTLDCPGSADVRSIALSEGAVCTSTVTKRRWPTTDGAEHHLRNPATGAKLDTGIASVSVIAAKAEQAEVLTKVAIASGRTRAQAILEANGVSGLLIDGAGEITELPGFADFRLGVRC